MRNVLFEKYRKSLKFSKKSSFFRSLFWSNKKLTFFGRKKVDFSKIFEKYFSSKKIVSPKKSFRRVFFSFSFFIICHAHPMRVASRNSLCAAREPGKRYPEYPENPENLSFFCKPVTIHVRTWPKSVSCCARMSSWTHKCLSAIREYSC